MESLLRNRRAVLLIAALALAQAWAFGVQLAGGFRPFGPAPGRVPLSWDMFAPELERCDVRWTPAIDGPYGPAASLSELGTRLEWNVVYPSADTYERVALGLCAHARAPTRVHLTCFAMDGRAEERDDVCPE